MRRIELWEPEVQRGQPTAFNAVITEAGEVDVQQVEWQIERRYHFSLEAAETSALFNAFATLLPASPAEDAKILMLVDERGARRGYLAEGHIYAAVRKAIDPTLRGEQPTESRGPYTGHWKPFP